MKSWQKYKRNTRLPSFMLEAPDLTAHTIKMIGMLLQRYAPSSPQENITKKSNELHNHFTLSPGQAFPP